MSVSNDTLVLGKLATSKHSLNTHKLVDHWIEPMRPNIRTKRVYEAPEASDGFRVLVDRVWPRGMSKERLQANVWLKSVAPSTQLRNWFRHDPSRWDEFKKRYFFELNYRPEGLQKLFDVTKRGPVTLLYSAKDPRCNQAVALKEFLSKHLKRLD